MAQPGTRLAYVGPFPPVRGGIAQHGEQLVEALRAMGVVVDVVSWRRQYPGFLYPGEQVLVGPDLPTHQLVWWSPLSWIRAGKTLAGLNGVVVAYATPIHAIPLWVLLRRVGGTRVAIVHNAYPHERLPFQRVLLKMVLGSIDHVIAHSGNVARQVEQARPGIPVNVITHPPNLPVEPAPMPEGPQRLLFFGYIRRYKGVDLLIRAVATLRRQGTEVLLTVAGEPWIDSSELRELASELAVADLVEFRLGYVSDSEVRDLIVDHHLIIQPYRSASQSGVIPLALAAGRGVVVTPVAGLIEAIADGENGIVASDISSDALASAIRTALEQVSQLSEGARRSATTWSAVAQLVVEALSPPTSTSD